MTSQSQTTSGPGPSESTAGNTAATTAATAGPVPLDRSSAEWRSQFGVLPSAHQQNNTVASQKKPPVAFIVVGVAILGVGGIAIFRQLPMRQAGIHQKAITVTSRTRAVIASGSSAKKLRDRAVVPLSQSNKSADAPTPAPSAAPPVKAAAKPAARFVPKPRPVVQVSTVVRAISAPEPKAAKPEPTPHPRRETPPEVVAPTLHPEPKAVVTKPVFKQPSKPSLAQQLPKSSRPSSHSESIESDGTNPLGLPQ